MDEKYFNLYSIILLLTLIQSLIFSFIFLLRSNKELIYSDKILSFLLFLLGLSTIPHLLGWLNIGILWNKFTFYPWNGLELAIVPTSFLYLKSRIIPNWKFSTKETINYSLYIIYFIYHLSVAVQGQKFATYWWFEVNNKFNIDAVFSFINLSVFIYFSFQLKKLLVQYNKLTLEQFSNIEKLDVKWIRNFFFAYLFFAVTDLILTIMELNIGAQYDKMLFAYIIVLLISYYISINGLINRPVLLTEEAIDNETNGTDLKSKTNNYSDEEIKIWKTKIEDYINREKSYLNPDLRLSELSSKFNINSNSLSTILNLCFEKNFNDLINEYRINYFINKVNEIDLNKYTLLSIAFDCGFNSKTTFNRAFKKVTAQNPSDYFKK